MALSVRVQQRVRYHLSYTQLTTLTGLSLGSPFITQAKFVVDSNLTLIAPEAEPEIVATVDRLDCIETNLDQLRTTMASGLKKSGATEFDYGTSYELLRAEYRRYQERLADQLAAFINPVSYAEQAQGVVEGDHF